MVHGPQIVAAGSLDWSVAVTVVDRLLEAGPAAQRKVIVGTALTGTAVAAAMGALVHPALALALIIGAAAGLAVLRSVDLAFVAVVCVITLLPFAAIPLGVGFNPTFLDLALGGLYAIWLFRLATREQTTLRWPPLAAGVTLLVGWMLVSFLAGTAQGMPSRNQIRLFAEMVMGAGLFLIVANLIHDRASLRKVFVALVALGGVAATIGLGLYVLPDHLEMEILSLLRVVDYPSGPGVLRYINDDPARLQRATGTAIDPNSFGGMLAVLCALVVPQIVARNALLPRRWAVVIAGIMALAILATVSRGSLLAVGVGIGVVGLFRDRRLLLSVAVGGLLLLVAARFLPWTSAYVANFTDGLLLQDRSTQMRLGEYKDAIRLIERYPLLGVGFGDVRDIDLYRGVSSLYLIVAETMGLVGLAIFVGVLATAAARLTLAWFALPPDGLRALVLGCVAALVAAATGGVFDHYFFTYPHAFALLWLIVGLGMGAVRLAREEPASSQRN